MIEFVYPLAFALLPLPLLVRLMRPYKRFVPHVRAPMYQQLATASQQRPQQAAWVHRRSPLQVFFLILNWCLVILAIARPQWVEEPLPIEQHSRDLVVLVDISGSMNERDGEGQTRLQRLKEALSDFAEQRRGDRLGLIVFADRPYLQAPLTADSEAWRALLLATRVGPAGRNTALGDAIGLGLKHLQGDDDRDKAMLLVTDGADNRSLVPPREAALVASQRGVRVYTVAIGDDSDSAEIDTATLQNVAEISGGEYYDARSPDAMARLSEDLAAALPSELRVEWYYPTRDLYHYPILFCYVFALLIAVISIRRQQRGGRL